VNVQHEPMTREQQNLFNAACGDLAHIDWHGWRLTKDDYRHLLCAMVLGVRVVPGVDLGEGAPRFIALGRSSKELSESQATEAIEMAFYIGDDPASQGLQCDPVSWSEKVRLARGITDTDDELAERMK
jgi:hypothetical protein